MDREFRFPTTSASLESDTLFRQVLENLYDGVYFTDRERRITFWNKAAEALTGYSAEEVIGKLCANNILAHVNDTGCLLCTGECPLSRCMEDRRAQQKDVFLHHKLGHRVPVSVRVAPIINQADEVIGAVEIFNDNSRQRAMQERAKELAEWAFLDQVSQVANRRYLEHQLTHQFGQFASSKRPFGIMLADLDNFKSLNDTYGHAAGDAALITIARTLSGAFRPYDVVGRWGGDEFVAILPGITHEPFIRALERCRVMVNRTAIPFEGRTITTTVSIGGALVTANDTLESLLKRADENLYKSKQAGRNRISL